MPNCGTCGHWQPSRAIVCSNCTAVLQPDATPDEIAAARAAAVRDREARRLRRRHERAAEVLEGAVFGAAYLLPSLIGAAAGVGWLADPSSLLAAGVAIIAGTVGGSLITLALGFPLYLAMAGDTDSTLFSCLPFVVHAVVSGAIGVAVSVGVVTVTR